MKSLKKIYIAGAVGIALAGVAACADLGFGVDVDSGGVNPYWYGNGYLGGTYWDTPVWNYGPIYNPLPPRPPLINNGIGPVRPPHRPQPAPRPPQINVRPTINTIPTTVGGMTRPGNGGLPNPSSVPKGQPVN
ncbi:MAG: hypothetical protein K2L28_04920 [Muribaculaceae bacterium]|nr:hypothetical protein [Muribaculaceae bacterium]